MATISFDSSFANISSNTITFTDTEHAEMELSTPEEKLLDAEETAQVEEKMTTAWEYFQGEWWQIHKDPDESDKELKASKKRLPIGKKEYMVLAATILGSLGLQVLFRDEPIMKGTTGATINAIKISYIQIPQGTVSKYLMRALAVATFVAGVTLYYVPEDSHGVVRILRAAPLTDMFMTIVLKCDVGSAKLDHLFNKAIKKCTGSELPQRLATAITKGFLAIVGGGLMNIPQYTGPFIASGAAVLAKANMRGVVDALYQTIEGGKTHEKRPLSINQKAAIVSVLVGCVAMTAASAYSLTLEAVKQSSFSWAPAAVLVIAGDTLGRTIKNSIKATSVPKEIIKREIDEGIRPPEQNKPWWKKCITVASGVGLVAATLGIAYVAGPATLPSTAGASVATNSGILTTICQEMGSMLKVASGKILSESVALFGSLGLLGVGASYHFFETFSGKTGLLSPVARATAAAFLAADMSVASYELKDHLRGGTNPDYKKNKKKKEAVELEVLV